MRSSPAPRANRRKQTLPWRLPSADAPVRRDAEPKIVGVIPLFERFFHSAAGIKIHKNDLRRFREFIDEQIDSIAIAIAGRDVAKWNAAT